MLFLTSSKVLFSKKKKRRNGMICVDGIIGDEDIISCSCIGGTKLIFENRKRETFVDLRYDTSSMILYPQRIEIVVFILELHE